MPPVANRSQRALEAEARSQTDRDSPNVDESAQSAAHDEVSIDPVREEMEETRTERQRQVHDGGR